MTSAKHKIEQVIIQYKKLFKNEYDQFIAGKAERLNLNKDEFGSSGEDTLVERVVLELPETLHNLINKKLNKDESGYYESKEGKRWVAKKYKEFRASEKI